MITEASPPAPIVSTEHGEVEDREADGVCDASNAPKIETPRSEETSRCSTDLLGVDRLVEDCRFSELGLCNEATVFRLLAIEESNGPEVKGPLNGVFNWTLGSKLGSGS
jgi:hypothetical protein